MTDVFAMVADERRGLADTLDRLDDAAWTQASLCEGWTVREVVAHLVWPTEISIPRILVEMVRRGFNFDRVADDVAKRETRPNAELVAALRANAESRFKPPGMGLEA